jgi:hypothetical protein
MGRSFPWASNSNDASITQTTNATQGTCKHRVQQGELTRRIVQLPLGELATSKMISNSTGVPSGRLATP